MNNHAQVQHVQLPCTCCEVAPNQPQSAIVAASYHDGDTSIQPPHYQRYSSHSGNLHPRLAGPSWHRAHSHPDLWNDRSPSTDLLQQRRDPTHGEAFGELVSHVNHQFTQPPWPTSDVCRYESRELINDVWGPRSTVHYGESPSHTAVPHLYQTLVHQHHTSDQVQDSQTSQSENVLRAFRQLEIRHPPMECPAPATAPPFAPNAQSAPVAQILNYPVHSTNSLHIQPPQVSSQTPVNWSAGPDHYLPQHTISLSSTPVNLTDAQWSISTETTTCTSPVFEPGWPDEGHSGNGTYRSHNPRPTQIFTAHNDHHPLVSPLAHRQAPLNLLTTQRAANRHKPKPTKMASSMVPRNAKSRNVRRSKPLSLPTKENAALMRKFGVCIRCKLFHVGCDSGTPCRKCDKAGPNARNYKEPCLRDNLSEAMFVRHCNGRLGQREAEFVAHKFMKDSRPLDMSVIWNLPGFGPIPNGHAIPIKIRQYLQEGNDTTDWRSSDGKINKMEQPAYAVVDTQHLTSFLEQYVLDVQPSIENWLLQRIQHDDIASHTIREVLRLRPNSELLKLVMEILSFSILSQGYGSVVSNNVPGIKACDFGRMGRSVYEAYNRDSCDRPLPAMMSNQCDVAMLKVLKSREKSCIQMISDRVFKPKIKPWYELFLTFFVLFWNLDYIHQGAQKYIISKHGTSNEYQISNVVSSQIEQWDISFPILMQYWPPILRGFVPFQLAREDPTMLESEGPRLDGPAIEYVKKMSYLFDRMGPFQQPPPLTGHASTQHSMGIKWIVNLFKIAGA